MAWIEAQKRYAKSEKGKAARKRYQESEKGKSARAKYLNRRKEAILESRSSKAKDLQKIVGK